MSVVDWADSARDQLADIWVAARPDERDEIARIVEQLIRRLKRDPMDVGESRSGGMRVEICPPLAVIFWVSLDQSLVRIAGVRRPRSGGS